MSTPVENLGLIAGKGRYPILLAEAVKSSGIQLNVVGFQGETDPILETLSTNFVWLRVGQLSKMIEFFIHHQSTMAIMAGQITPTHLFDLKPDLRALLLLARLKKRNAESIFRGIAEELSKEGIELLPATSFLEHHLAREGVMHGPTLKKRELEDIHYGFHVAKEIARLDIGQSVVVKRGTVLAVEAFEGTDACMRRGGPLGRGEAVLVKVSKANQDFRFDVPIVGPQTLETAKEAGIRVIACETACTLLLDEGDLCRLAKEYRITLYGQPNTEIA